MVEVPLLLFATLVATALVLPHLPPLGRKIFIGLAAVPVLFSLFYMIVVPGWTPGSRPGTYAWLRLAVFAVAAGFVLFVVGAFIVGH